MSASDVARPPGWRVLLAGTAVAALIAGAAWWVDLAPKVDSDFFFAPGDPALEAEQTIADRFGELGQVVILATSPELDARHVERIEALSRDVAEVDGVVGVHSLARGPDGVADARDSPLWRRLLLAGDGETSFLIADVREAKARSVVEALERIAAAQRAPGFDLALAGVPYTVEVMRRQLVRDFAVFSAAAVAAFGVVILVVFRSSWILLGTLASCLGAVAATLVALQALGFGIGLLTANLTTIVFVLTQSHVVFLATNWQAQEGGDADPHARMTAARGRTLRASLGSAATTFLGFASLWFVPAQPLRELGAGGCLGALLALLAAYAVMPFFLERAKASRAERWQGGWLRAPGPRRAAAVVAACLAAGVGLLRLDTDPSLLAYFDDDTQVHAALAKLDRAGGSSPLTLVVQREGRPRLDSQESYRALWELQRALEQDPAVGRSVSLPLLIAETERFPGVSLLPENWIVSLLGPEVTGAFLTEDRRQTLFLLQMAETERDGARSRVVERVREIAREQGFQVPLLGGIYQLQARLSELVARSVVWSLAALVVLFAGVAALAGGSLRVGAAAGAATGLVPLAALGTFGVLGVPLDVIAAPSASVGLGLAADASLHLIAAWRRRRDAGDDAPWRAACAEQWRGIARASGIVVLGFGLFLLSGFPPTRRFGAGVALATAVGALVSLWVLPVLARAIARSRKQD